MYKSNAKGKLSIKSELGGQVDWHSAKPYPHRLNFYDKPPLYDVTLEEFESCAIDRLRILAEIEASFARNRQWDDLKRVTQDMCNKYLPLHANTAIKCDVEAERRRDQLGHFILRLAFCRSEELRKRFVKAEATLFRIRYDNDDNIEREEFLNSRDFNWTAVSTEEKDKHEKGLIASSGGKVDVTKEKYYKVKWSRVPDLIEKRKVYLYSGWAYVPSREQSSIVFQELEIHLTKALELTAKSLPRLDEDTRLVPILSNLSQGFLAGVPSEWAGDSNVNAAEGLKAEQVDEIARKHYPMCMRNLHGVLRSERHLKHFARLQYGLFLKVLGLSIEEAVAFWRKSFSKLSDDQFNKNYKYNIRHSYGLEGKRANYSAWSCQQILLQNQPGPSDCHGCPYRHFSGDNLPSALLAAYPGTLTQADIPDILHTVKAGHPHIACTRVFEITHSGYGVKKGEGLGGGECVTHPNQYAARSRELEKERLESLKGPTDDSMIIGD